MRYFTIQEFMITHLKLSGNELLVYAIIFGFSQDGASLFYGSYNYIAGWLNCSQRVVINTIKKLEKKGFIEKILDGKNGNKYRITDKYKTIASEQNSEVKTTTSEQNSEPTSEQNSEVTSEKNSDNNNIYNYNNINNINNNINIITESDDSDTEEISEKEIVEFGKTEINEVIGVMKTTLEENGLFYQKESVERNYAKHICTAKEFGAIAEKFGISRIEFVKNIIILSCTSDFWRGKICNPRTLYRNYSKVLNEASAKNQKMLTEKNYNFDLTNGNSDFFS